MRQRDLLQEAHNPLYYLLVLVKAFYLAYDGVDGKREVQEVTLEVHEFKGTVESGPWNAVNVGHGADLLCPTLKSLDL
jgi:hypothetical protein